MNQQHPSPSEDWNARASHGDEELLNLLTRQDELFAAGSYRNESDVAAIRGIAALIRKRQEELGIDPLEGPEYSGR